MSLNWREIEAVLSELTLEGSWLKRIRQPDYRRIILEFSKPGTREFIALVLNPPFVRINRMSPDRKLPQALPRPPRFTSVIKSRIEGSKLRSIAQLGKDRIVRFTFERAGENLYLDAKLWGNAANLILCSENGTVLDAFSRRPKRGEAPGGLWPPEGVGITPTDSEIVTADDDGRFPLRDLPGEGDWNNRVEDYYRNLENEADRKKRRTLWESHLDRRISALELKAQRMEKSIHLFESQGRNGHWADLILAYGHTLSKGDSFLETEDWESPGSNVRIPLDTTLSPRENAERYYVRQKRSARGLDRLAEDRGVLEQTSDHLKSLRKRIAEGDIQSPPFDEDPPLEKKRGVKDGDTMPGIWIRKNPYIIVVGRNAKESDRILRHWARGNDTWLHTRDWPGGHVFVRAPRGKSIPLEILLDAGNLALSYSKGRSSMEADLYYAQVKNLRRAKDGPVGTVLPTHEKNFRVRLEPQRLEALKAFAESG